MRIFLHVASRDYVHIITADKEDASTFDAQLHGPTRNDTGLAVESLLYQAPTDSRAASRSDLSEHLVESRGTRSPNSVALQPNSAHEAAAAPGLECVLRTHFVDETLAEIMPDGQTNTVGVTSTIVL